jgi:hypothetical protein
MISRCLLQGSFLPAMLGWALLAVPAAAQDYYGQGRVPAPTQTNSYTPFSPTQARQPLGGQPLRPMSSQAAQPAYLQYPVRVAENVPPAATGQTTPPVGSGRRPEFMTRLPGEHPLMPAIRWAKDGLRDVGRIKDY